MARSISKRLDTLEKKPCKGDARKTRSVADCLDWLITAKFQSNPPGEEQRARDDVMDSLRQLIREEIAKARNSDVVLPL